MFPPLSAPLRVAYVDDDDNYAALFQALSRRVGHRVTAFRDADEALAVAEGAAAPFDLFVSDLNMPRLSGFDTAGRVRSRWPDMKVGIISTEGVPYTIPAPPWGAHLQVWQKPWNFAECQDLYRVILDPHDAPDAKGVAWVRVVGHFDAASVPDYRARFDAAIKAAAESVVVDLSRASSIDSAALGLLLAARDNAVATGLRLRLHGAQGEVRRLLHLYGFDRSSGFDND